MSPPRTHCFPRTLARWFFVVALTGLAMTSRAAIVWNDTATRVIHRTPVGSDILAGKLSRDDTASDALYFTFHVDPLSDAGMEPYYALFQLYEGDEPRLAVGNAPEAWGYSACYTSETGPSNKVSGEFNLNSSRPEAAGLGQYKPYEVVRAKDERTIVFKIQYIPGGDDLITVWLSPQLSRGDSEENQPEILTTKFKANASFNQIRLRHDPVVDQSQVGEVDPERGGNGWIFSDMAIATSFKDFIVVHFWQTWWFTTLITIGALSIVIASVRLADKRKYQYRLRLAEQERALERERGRIAQDLHDELGSLLARISLLSGLARQDMSDSKQVITHVTKIGQAADETVRALEEIVWAVRPGSDSLQSLVEYIAHFSNELFEGNGTRCRLDLPPDLPSITLLPEMRHNIFLVIKEALTNVLKHANAKEVHVQAKATLDTMEFTVKDDGSGFNSEKVSRESKRNGLPNMRRRADEMGGKFSVETTPQGTTVRLIVKVARPKMTASFQR